MVKAKKVGLDGGNGITKAFFEGASEGLLIPSIRKEVLYVQDISPLDIGSIDLKDIENYLDITFDSSKALPLNSGERFYIGNIVSKLGISDGFELEATNKKFKETLPVHMMLAALLVDAIKSNPDKKNITAKYDLSLALPLIDTNKESYNIHAERLMGRHELTYHHPNGIDEVKVKIDVEFATTSPEGAIGAYAVVYDNNGNPKKYTTKIRNQVREVTFENMKLLLNDIGGGTTEHAHTEGVRFNYNLSIGKPYGAKETLLKIQNDWNANPDNNYDQIETATQFTEIYTNPEKYIYNELREFARPYLKVDAQRIVKNIIDLYTKINDSSTRIIFYGGGSILFEEEIRHQISEKDKRLLDNVIFMKDPIFTNARGLLNFSLTPSFEKRKKAALLEASK